MSDVVIHGMEVFSPLVDGLIREVHRRGGHRELGSRLYDADPRCGGRPDLAALETLLREVLDQLRSQGA